MWDVMSGDYDAKQKPEKIINRVQKLTRPGSVIVFHDTIKAGAVLKFILHNIFKSEVAQSEFIRIKE